MTSPKRAAESLRASLRLPERLSTSALTWVAAELGGSMSFVERPQEAGRVDRTGDGWHITIDCSASPSRQRFTMAHELGHILADRYPLPMKNEERWCDRFATELLMPESLIITELRCTPESLAGAERVSQRCEVSTSAAVLRMRELCNWSSGFVVFRERHHRWVVFSLTGFDRDVKWSLSPAAGTSEVLAQVPTREQSVEIPIYLRERATYLSGRAMRRGDTVRFLGAFAAHLSGDH